LRFAVREATEKAKSHKLLSVFLSKKVGWNEPQAKWNRLIGYYACERAGRVNRGLVQRAFQNISKRQTEEFSIRRNAERQ